MFCIYNGYDRERGYYIENWHGDINDMKDLVGCYIRYLGKHETSHVGDTLELHEINLEELDGTKPPLEFVKVIEVWKCELDENGKGVFVIKKTPVEDE